MDADGWEPDRSAEVAAPRRRRRVWRISLVALAGVLAVSGWLYAFAPQALPPALTEPFRSAPAYDAPIAPRIYADGAYRFTRTQPGPSTKPVGYDPCRTVYVEVNLDGAPRGAMLVLQRTLARVHRASGLDLRIKGTTDRRPGEIFGARPVLVAWATPSTVPQLRGGVVGIGGSATPARTDKGETVHYVSGQLVLDKTDFAGLSESQRQAVMDHEFGHVVGLAHVKDRNQIMYPTSAGQIYYGHGDLTGLALLGRVPCG